MTVVPKLSFVNEIDNMGLYVRAAEVSTAVGQIDYHTIDSMQIVPGARSTPDGAAIAFDWGRNASGSVAPTRQLGYLTGTADATSKYQASLNNTVSLQILGVGNTLRSKKSRAWTNTTISNVLSEVLGDSRINLVMDDEPTRWSRITQQNESDWSLVCKLAKQVGFWPYLNHSTLYVMNPDTLATRQTLQIIDPSTSNLLDQKTSDTPQMGEALVADRIGRYMDQATGLVQHLPAQTRVQVANVARPDTGRVDNLPLMQGSHSEAQTTLEGANRNAAWYIERKITIDGRNDLKPLMPVVIPNTRVRRTRTNLSVQQGWEQYDGVWLVKSVDASMKFHHDNCEFTTTLTVVRDSRGPGLNQRQLRAVPVDFTKQPTTNLLNGQWVAGWRNN